MTEKTNRRDFWDPESIQPLDSSAVPILIDKTNKLGDVTTEYLYQESVSRLCTQPHHVPLPLNLSTIM